MVYRTRLNYTTAQKTEMWDRWQRGESLNAIGRAFDRPSSSIFAQLSESVYSPHIGQVKIITSRPPDFYCYPLVPIHILGRD